MTAPNKAQVQTKAIEREPSVLDKIIAETEKFRRDVEPLREVLTSAAPKWFDVSRIYAGLDAAIVKEPKILKADKKSLYLALARVARWGLDIGDGVDLVIQPARRKDEAGNWQSVDTVEAWPDYKGLKVLAKRNGLMRDANEFIVYEGDDFEPPTRTERGVTWSHTARTGSPDRKIIAAYSVITKPMNQPGEINWLWFEEIEERRTKSRGWSDAALRKQNEGKPADKQVPLGCRPWYAKKTAWRDWANRQPKSGLMGAALKAGEEAESLDPELVRIVDIATDELKQPEADAPTEKQLAFFQRLIKSSVWTTEEVRLYYDAMEHATRDDMSRILDDMVALDKQRKREKAAVAEADPYAPA